MRGVTAEAAGRFGWVYDPSFIIGCNLLAGSGLVGKHCSAEEVVPSIGSVNSFAVVGWVIEFLSIDSIGGFVDDEGFIEADPVGVVVDGWFYCFYKLQAGDG